MENLLKVYFGPYKKQVALIVIMLIIQVTLQIFIINSIRPIITNGINDVDTHTIMNYGIYMLLMIVLYSLTTVYVSHMAARISAESVSKIRDDMFKKILSFKRPRDSGANMSGLMNRLVTDVNYIQEFITEALCTGLYVPLLAIAVTIVTATFNPPLCLTLTISFIVMVIIMIRLAKGELKVRSKLQRFFDRTIHIFREMLVGARTSRAFDDEKSQLETFSQCNAEFSTLTTKTTAKVSSLSSFSTLVLIIVMVLIYTVFLVNSTNIIVSSDVLIIFIQYLVLFISCASITPFIVTTMPRVKSSFARISKVMNGISEPGGLPVPEDYDGPTVECANGIIVKKGTEVSLVGRTGAGKSEFILDMLRLEDVEPGKISFKGSDITELDPHSLRRSIAYAGNLATAFKGSVLNNVRVWRDISDERVAEAMKAAKLDLDPEMILEKFGSNISMGQIQKISIARALAADADLYIFDDCFTELDPKTENEIVSNIRGMLRGRTVLFSSHQMRIATGSDTVMFMDGGKVIANGTHDDLVDNCETYRRMYYAGGGYSE